MAFDPIDYQILDLLQTDAQTTQMDIAAKVGLSQPAVADRVRKLEESGAIVRYVARVDPRAMGNDIRAFVGVRISHPRHHEPFARRILDLPEVLECHRVAGLDSYLLKVVTRDTESLDRLISDSLRRIAGVTRTHTTVVLSAVKEETRVPLQQQPETESRRRRKKEVAA
ncbi:MAG: Lrp/AsnC family transcriptional regulator [Deltaproteobacteria bacterium]|nr:MAG: Lrp/AsnC family transcriptional regulator [Deltaproteobacteria bacterium]TMB37737.1 MAG: Lrp/AsnC family transcriptional regulator [Deltaproteobacteria bacterium]